MLLAGHGMVETQAMADETTVPASAAAVEKSEPKRARVRVDGMWFFKNRNLREILKVLEPEETPMPVLDAAFIEDAVLVLQGALDDDGFLRSSGMVRLHLVDGTTLTAPWKHGSLPELPRDLAADEATFELEPGVFFYLAQLDFVGLESVDAGKARAYFVSEGPLLSGNKARKFTPAGLERGRESLLEELKRAGRLEAKVEVQRRDIDEASGAVSVSFQVSEGLPHRIGAITPAQELPETVRAMVEERIRNTVGKVYSSLQKQDFQHGALTDLFKQGYAHATASLIDDGAPARGAEVVHTLVLECELGPQVRVGEVGFSGDPKTRTSVLRRATDVRSGQLFDRGRIEDDRLNLSTLGSFAAVRADVDEQSPELWDLTYQLRPSKRMEVGVLGGYGSYEKLRGGIELFHANQFGRAERGRMSLIESTKSTSADYQLTVPQIFGTTADANGRMYGLIREEVSFERRDYGVSLGARKHLQRFGVDVAVRYQFESLNADNVAPDLLDAAPEDSKVGAITLDIIQDKRDNPLTPRVGYDWSVILETAAKAIGGEVDYQRMEAKASWHAPLGGGRHLHLGLRHSLIWSIGSPVDEIPVGKRFYPGGESTVRGYTEGTAGPRGPTGEIIGAEASTIANIEFDQALLKNLSGIVFVDTGVTAASIEDYPGDQVRVSIGVGLRYNSLIGPARLEYGHNVVRETGDQQGELHFALGFPF